MEYVKIARYSMGYDMPNGVDVVSFQILFELQQLLSQVHILYEASEVQELQDSQNASHKTIVVSVDFDRLLSDNLYGSRGKSRL